MYDLFPQWLRMTISRAKKQLCGRGHTLDRNATLEQLEGRRLLAITASISGNSSVNEGSNYTLNLSASGGTPIHWDINWGDGYDPDGNGDGKQRVSGNPASVTHKYADGWNFYTVRGTAYETATASYNSNNKFVTVVDVPPTPGISGSAFAYKDRPYVLNLIEHDPGQDTISAWKIDWGDGSAEQTIAGDPASVTHTYATTGTRTRTARVVNEDGTFPASPNAYNRRDITVQDGAPLDELLVDSRSDAVVSGTAVLKDGVKYKLVASGWGAMDLNNIRSMDAEYYDTQSATPRDKTNDGMDFGITRAVPWNGGTIATNWGAYRSDHVYEMEITGDGRPLSLKFIDRVGFYNDNAGVLAVAVFPLQRAFGGTTPPQAPGLFEAENFDDGGEGVAYHDATRGNYYGTQYKRREDADVDIVRDETTGGFEIDHVSAGEWLEYTITVPTAGTYELATRVGAPGTGGVFHWEMDGTDITGPLNVPNTDSHWKYEWVRTNVTLPAGEHVFRLSMDVNGQWLDNRSGVGKFDAFAITNPAAVPAAPTTLAAPFTFRNRVDLTWTDATNNETDYELERGTDGVNFVKVKTLRGNLTSFTDTGLSASTTYHYRLRATNTAGPSGYSNTIAVTTPAATATPYKINFQTDHTPPVLGYKVDSGDLYGDRGDGLTYGWNIDHTLQDRDRGTGIDRKLDTLVGMRDGGVWEISLPNGSYDVLVSIGDAHWASTNTLNVEGTNYWDALPLAKNQFRQKTVGVQVTDGKLTLDAGSRPKEGARLNYIEITPGGSATVVNIAATDAVAVENATPANTAMFTVTRQSGNLGGSLPVYFTLFGSAGFPGDYTVVGATSGSETRWQVTIPPDQPAATFEIVPVADDVTEPTLIGETVDATLATAPGYTVGNSPSARANIYESTPPPADVVISIELVSNSAIDEGSDQILRYRVSRTGSTAQAQWVNFEPVTGTNYSEQGVDWVYHNLPAGASGFAIQQNASEAFIEIRSLEDTVEEGNEPVTLQLRLNGNLYTIDPQADRATGTIIDDDGDGDPGDFTLSGAALSAQDIDLDWQAFPGSSGYRVEISADGLDFFDSAEHDSATLSVTAIGFKGNQRFFFRVVALNGADALATSNVVEVVTQDDGLADSAIPTFQASSNPVAAAPNATKLLVPFNGAYPPGADSLDVFGNAWFERLTREAGGSIKPNPGQEVTYRYHHRQEAMVDLLTRIDTNSDRIISTGEAQAVKVVVTGFSWGGVEAVNFSRELSGNIIHTPGPDYHLDAAIPVELLITIDSPREGVARFKPTWGPVETNVQKFINWYQRRGGGTSFGLWAGGSTGNGTSFPAVTKLGDETRLIDIPFGGPLKGTTFKTKLPASRVQQINVTGFGLRNATNVEYFKNPLRDPAALYSPDNYFDADLVAGTAQHDIMVWYVRGGVGAQFAQDFNALKEIDAV